MKILITGLSGSGKTTLSLTLKSLLSNSIYLNGDDIRRLYNDWDFSPEHRLVQAKRFFDTSATTPEATILADFICPTEATRRIFKPDFIIYMATTKSSQYADTDALYEPPYNPDFTVISKDAERWAPIILGELKNKFPFRSI